MRNCLLKCKPLLLVVILTFTSIYVSGQGTITGDGTKLGGYLVRTIDDLNTPLRGFYTFAADTDLELTAQKLSDLDMMSGIPYNGTYYGFSRIYDFSTGGLKYYHCSFNMETWQLIEYKSINGINAPFALTLDPVSKQFFAISLDTEGVTSYTRLSTYDLNTLTATDIGKITGQSIPSNGFATLAADVNGDIYGIGYNGNFYKIDKTTANATLIGHLGVEPSAVSSMAFDHKTNKLYWAGCLIDFYSNLYEIDIQTGIAHEIAKFPLNESFAGLYVIGPAAEDNAPSKPIDLKLTSTSEGSLTYNIDFKTPTTTHAGKPLSDNVKIEVWINDELIHSAENVTPGSDYNHVITFTEPAEKKVEVYLENDFGKSPKAKIVGWVGPDRPGAISSLKTMRTSEGNVLLTWEAPSMGANNGYLDLSSLSYQIVRNEDEQTLATDLKTTTFTDDSDTEPMYYTYTITPTSTGGDGITTTSDKTYLGNSMTLPYQETFDSSTPFTNYWNILNPNGGATWKWNRTMKDIRYSNNNDGLTADDWAFSAPFKMQTNTIYKIKYKLTSQSSSNPENFNVTLSTSFDPKEQTITLGEYKDVKINFKDAVPYTNYAVVPENAEYYLGFYCYSGVKGWNVIFDDVSIEAIEVPSIVDLNGSVEKNNVQLNWGVPESIEGVPVIGYNVYRNGEKITENPLTESSYKDIGLADGKYDYQITVIYELIESESSNTYSATITTTNTPNNLSREHRVYGQNEEIIIENAVDKVITLYTIDGKQLLNINNIENIYHIPVSKGVYIVRVGGDITKIVVK